MSSYHGFETLHGLMPQIMGNEIPDYMSDDKKEMNHVMSPYNVV